MEKRKLLFDDAALFDPPVRRQRSGGPATPDLTSTSQLQQLAGSSAGGSVGPSFGLSGGGGDLLPLPLPPPTALAPPDLVDFSRVHPLLRANAEYVYRTTGRLLPGAQLLAGAGRSGSGSGGLSDACFDLPALGMDLLAAPWPLEQQQQAGAGQKLTGATWGAMGFPAVPVQSGSSGGRQSSFGSAGASSMLLPEEGTVTLYQAAYLDRLTAGRGMNVGSPRDYPDTEQGSLALLAAFVTNLCKDVGLQLPSWLEPLRTAEAAAAAEAAGLTMGLMEECQGQQQQQGQQQGQHPQQQQKQQQQLGMDWRDGSSKLFDGTSVLELEGSGGAVLFLDTLDSPTDGAAQRIGLTCKGLVSVEAAQRAFKACMVAKWGEEVAGLPIEEWTVASIPHAHRARKLGKGLVAEWTTGGNCQSLVTILRLQQGGELVGKAQLKYRDPKNATFGPVLKRLVVAKHLRCRGLGRALLGEVERVAADHFPPLLPCVEMVLQLGRVRGHCGGWFRRRGFRSSTAWDPFCTEPTKAYYADPPCTCGQCAGGWLSPAMAGQLSAVAQFASEDLRQVVAAAEASGRFGTKGPGRKPLDERQGPLPACLSIMPPYTRAHQLYKSFLQGYAECFETINKLLLRDDVPSAAAVLRQWALDFRAANTRTFYLERGGTVELALHYLIDQARHLAPDDYMDGLFEKRHPRCAKDFAFSRVAKELLGPDAIPERPGCEACGTTGAGAWCAGGGREGGESSPAQRDARTPGSPDTGGRSDPESGESRAAALVSPPLAWLQGPVLPVLEGMHWTTLAIRG